MKLFIKLRNKYLTGLLSLVLLVMASIGLFNFSKNPQTVDASSIKLENESNITITNGSFSNYSSSSGSINQIKDFTTSGNSTLDMKTGVIDVSASSFAKNYEKYGLDEYKNPGKQGSDNYILMINSKATTNYTYTSSEFTLPANGHYYISVSAMTLGDNSVASVFLTQNDVVFENCIIENITTSSWANYTFFVSTNAYESVTLKFNMQLGNLAGGASGCVFFDELHAGQISSEVFADAVTNYATGSYKIAELRSPNLYKGYNFDDEVYTLDKDGNVNVADETYFTESVCGIGANYIDNNNNQLNITTDKSYVTFKGKEEVLQANSTYRFSIFAKASDLSSGSAFVQLDEILEEDEKYDDFMGDESEEITAKSSKLTISGVTSNSITNGYQEYVIYVRTGALSSSKVQFSFGLGSEGNNATGNISFKSYLVERVPYSAYSGATTGSTLEKMDIASRLTLSSNEFSNYSFDNMESESFDGVPYPAKPSSWTKSNDGVGYQLSGVVNLSEFDKVMNKYSNEIETTATPKAFEGTLNNNVLMLYNGTASTQSYTSSSKTLTANKYYKITVFVNTHTLSDNGVTILAKSGDNVLGKVTGINTGAEWQKVEMYIDAPVCDIDLSLELALGYEDLTASGYAFFDNILFEESETASDFGNLFNEYDVAENGTLELDLTNTMLTSTKGGKYETPVLYKGQHKSGDTKVKAGVVDLTGDLKIIAQAQREALRQLSGSDKVLAIVSETNKDARYEYTSVLNYTFNSETYYKFSFELFTYDFGQEDKDEKYDNKVLAEGVNISLTNLENATFKYVQSNGKWTTYEIYIGVKETATSNFVFSLGSEFTGCYGKAFVGNISLEETDEATFKEAMNSDTILKVDTVKKDEDKNTSSSKSDNGFSWVYIPTIATFLAIIVAVVGVFVKRNIKFKKFSRTKKAEYDRDITVMQNKYRRVASDTRDKEVRELTKECNELINLRTEYEDKYKDALSRLRSARLANRDGSKRNEIMAIEKEVKHISKEVARFGVQINNYENEIEFMKTEAYLIDLEKDLMREDNYSRNVRRKEDAMSEEERAQAIAKREAKQERLEQKAQDKADKLALKQEKLQQQREQVQLALQQAKELDEKYVKEQELKQIKLEELKLAKEKAKAEHEIAKLEQQKAKQKAEEVVVEQATSEVEKVEETAKISEVVEEIQVVEDTEKVEGETEEKETQSGETVEPITETNPTDNSSEE